MAEQKETQIKVQVGQHSENIYVFLHVVSMHPRHKAILGANPVCQILLGNELPVLRYIFYDEKQREDIIGMEVCQRRFLKVECGDAVTVKPYTEDVTKTIPLIQGKFHRKLWSVDKEWTFIPEHWRKWTHYKSLFIGHVFYPGEALPVRCAIFGEPPAAEKSTICMIIFTGLLPEDVDKTGVSFGYRII